ncbi:VF530 family DNA-binding protein [Psychromonas sp. KJ10-2]|uniref:VF530 family protein n=1 Tax=Psychromonas sp. KJ10-2 TaxID=3391822 RepID=UPI0039B378BA
MSAELQRNNPLHGLKTETMLTELVEFYGWKILFAATRFKCFDVNPTIKGSLKFLQKQEWARLKLESFYLYRFKRMPKPNDVEFNLNPRERGFEHGIVPLSPMKLTIESIELSQAKAASAFQERQNEKRHSNNMRHRKEQGSRHPMRDAKVKSQSTTSSKNEPKYDPSNPWNV